LWRRDWLYTEYRVVGDELYNYLLSNGPIPADKVRKIFAQLVGAVAYVHDMSCVHRDLKLENILLDKYENVKLCDFGFTREYEGKASYLQTFCGTVCYSAPEMLKGEKYAGEKVDVWSLGIILYALLAGELPFDEDNDTATKVRILTCEPRYPSQIPDDAKGLIQLLLSKRPLMRPTLTDILGHPFLVEHAPQQQAILNLTQPTPFNTRLEKDTLERMRSAGVDIDKVIENVIAQRCDSLAGWWALLIGKEERKEKRRERKRREKEANSKNLRRLSAASTRLEKTPPTVAEVNQESRVPDIGDPPRSRGRRERRSLSTRKTLFNISERLLSDTSTAHLVVPDLPQLPEGTAVSSPRSATPPPPIEKDSIRSESSSRHRPPPPPKERRRSRGSTLQLVSANPDLLSPNGFNKRRPPRRHQHPIINQLASIKHWFMESAKRAKSPASRSTASTLGPVPEKSPDDTRRPSGVSTVKPPGITVPSRPYSPPLQVSPRPRVPIRHHRDSLSPAPLTPRSSYRRPSTGLRGRKSTSSSVSSIRSIHHVHTHSKASSTSSNSITTSTSTNINKVSRSPHTSVKVLPATPTTSAFPSNIRIVRQPPSSTYNDSATFNPPTGLVFAKRKRSPFKGPMLNVTNTSISSSSAFLAGHGHGPHPNSNNPAAGGSSTARGRDSSIGGSRSASVVGRTSGEIIEEEDEDEIEEVEVFSPVVAGERTAWGETVIEETIFEGSEGGRAGFVDYTR